MQMRQFFPVLVVSGLFAAGCGEPAKPESGARPAAAPAESKPAGDASFAGYAQNLSKAEKTAVATVDLRQLNQAVQQFGATEGRLPASLEELVKEKYLVRIPAPPRGQRIVYDPKSGDVRLEAAP